MGFCKLTLYEEIIKIDQPKLEGVIGDYIIHLRQDKKLSPASISAYIAALAHFCEMNDITIRWRKLKKVKGKFRDIIEYRPYTTEQIKKLVDVASLRDKCIILLMTSTGIRRSARLSKYTRPSENRQIL
jgi:site-specific recombinase XerD